MKSDFAPTTDEMIVRGEELLKKKGLVVQGDTILMLAGQSHTAGRHEHAPGARRSA